MTMADAARDSGVAYATIYRHVVLRGGMRTKNARKLEAWSKGAISAAKSMRKTRRRAKTNGAS
jgi:hypothetical protein